MSRVGGVLLSCLILVSFGGMAWAGSLTLISYGDRGAEVLLLQKDLNALGYKVAPLSGYFGPITLRKVKQLQVNHGLVADGVVGPRTRMVIQKLKEKVVAGSVYQPEVRQEAGGIITTPSGQQLSYSRVVEVRATAYSAGPSGGSRGSITSRGVRVRPGIIAVNPRIVPLGSKVFITGYRSRFLPSGGFIGWAVDTGRGVKGIDVYLPTRAQALNFGVQRVKVYLLK